MSVLIETKHLKKYFSVPGGQLHAVDDVSIKIRQGKTLGVVGESGCGKSTLGRTLIHLLDSTEGNILFDGEDITHVNRKGLTRLRRNMQIIFQDPYASLNPRMTAEPTITEPLRLSGMKGRELEEETEKLMERVGIESRLKYAYPHELDGGRRQRIGIGRALALNPKFVVCDEPVSALDVSIQAQVLNLLSDLQSELGTTYLFVTHDLSVVKHISDEICVMYLGQVVELAESGELFQNPLHPYTKALLSAIPSTNIHKKSRRIILKGEVTSPINPGPGCRFASRCPYAAESCSQPQTLADSGGGHLVSCGRIRELS